MFVEAEFDGFDVPAKIDYGNPSNSEPAHCAAVTDLKVWLEDDGGNELEIDVAEIFVPVFDDVVMPHETPKTTINKKTCFLVSLEQLIMERANQMEVE